ncbi:MAG: GTP-binding protein [Candidatus Dojkabacteria bacterium]|nr:MAG: GTP-binding protein [Candidatus Dojkabacteria bacterium]
MTTQENIRNIAIIAHVDHGKTSLVDSLMKQAHIFRENQEEMGKELILDSGELEREKGITIRAKNISIPYKGFKINIIDTPGHADFGGEVERTLSMADGCILLVDAQEGPMPQTRFVTKKAFELGLRPIVLINKIDKSYANPARALDKVTDLILSLATDESQLDFTVLYGIGRIGKIFSTLPAGDLTQAGDLDATLEPLLEAIVSQVPAPKGDVTAPFQMQVNGMEYDTHVGRYLIGKISRGTVHKGDSIVLMQETDGEVKTHNGKADKILTRDGIEFVEVDSALAGEIIAIAGIDVSGIGGTICDSKNQEMLPPLKLSNPSVKITFEANTSPLAGKEGKFVTMKLLQQRLDLEKENNVGLTIKKIDESSCSVEGRGELQLSILIETLRREGYEFQVRKPEVVMHKENDVLMEPLEELYIDVPEDYVGTITQALSSRNAVLGTMDVENGQAHFIYKILTRNLLGLRLVLLTATKGNVIMNNFLAGYVPVTKQPEPYRKGVLIGTESGKAIAYALNTVQERGDLFIIPGDEVYEGMIIGINKYPEDLDVNPAKAKHSSSVRQSSAVTTDVKLKAPLQMSLEFALSFMAKDEMLEVTPINLRLRKIHLSKTQRDVQRRKDRQLQSND